MNSNCIFTIFFAFATLVPINVLAEVPSDDLFAQCMTRTRHDRQNCQNGCGMILQQCYDEGIADINRRVSQVSEIIKYESGIACEDIVQNYLNEAFRMEGNVEKQVANLSGWIGNELALSFARQRLHNVLLIQHTCKQ